MIRTQYLKGDQLQTGGKEQIEIWRQQGGAIWVDIEGEEELAEQALLDQLECHPLAVQDAQRHRHPPKFEDFGNNTFVIYRGFERFDEDISIAHVQVSFFISSNALITRRNGTSYGVEKLWGSATDLQRYLPTPAILFTRIVNQSLSEYIKRMLELEDAISQMEDEMLEAPTDQLMQRFVLYRSRLRKLNRVFRYHEKVFAEIMRESTAVLDMNESSIYHSMQDVYDKCERLDSLGTLFYEQCGDLIEGYISLTSHQLNKTMQALTVITAIFVPLGLLSGIYGMNFENMPELHSQNGYFVLLSVMATVAISLLIFFRRKRWL
ncbi:MAG: metal transporter [Pseudomonadales bacterium]|jgi:magnesium transporter|uniref:magnesium transporter CorA family protein n=1 Tax=unclassified Ketobacter TaxID=2639109 RepID=UPI000C981214|nr:MULTISPECIES: magnesium transporter CorA family protein [unclassified Ketobacter]MAQ24861.1 metal transporter [Pseudomonadales bacterium]MEC8811603.1 magnesium transporter CorA family protein [Pseudomonadota bacterium]TNC90293.1 MAG: metal transporter [Alcanivorax sp.]HAG96178.1 metal transporter [Gammaproteobacteria bacterium]MCK5790490.1 magnesium transporter CorA family protein [Ketobacter sp.]|tara:strand:+ start:403 stop:1368 length:966 start_codon:yes stop_codon:yes gene_type:complete